MNKYPSPIVIMVFGVCCFTAGSLRAPLGKWIDSKFSPPEPGADAAMVEAPARLYRITAYCPGSCCCGKWADGLTASGKPAVGLIVAAPSDTKFGTVLDIPGYGWATVQDRGGAITGNRLDVLFPTYQEALNWGVQKLKVRRNSVR